MPPSSRLKRSIMTLVLTAMGCATPGSRLPSERSEAKVTYLGNDAVLVARGKTAVMVDPLYFDWPDSFRVVPSELRRRIFVGEAPFDAVQAILITHVHGDHFFTRDLLHYLDKRPNGRVYVPRQGYDKLAAEPSATPAVLARVTAIDLSVGDPPKIYEEGGLRIEAVRVPHVDIGRPNEVMDHLVYRVTLEADVTFTHLGDATPSSSAYQPQAAFWRARPSDLVFAPFWFFTEGDVDLGLLGHTAVGLHVWPKMPAELEGKAVELLLEPGESCLVRAAQPSTGERICGAPR